MKSPWSWWLRWLSYIGKPIALVLSNFCFRWVIEYLPDCRIIAGCCQWCCCDLILLSVLLSLLFPLPASHHCQLTVVFIMFSSCSIVVHAVFTLADSMQLCFSKDQRAEVDYSSYHFSSPRFRTQLSVYFYGTGQFGLQKWKWFWSS